MKLESYKINKLTLRYNQLIKLFSRVVFVNEEHKRIIECMELYAMVGKGFIFFPTNGITTPNAMMNEVNMNY